MVVRISTGKSVYGLIRYNESKRRESSAKLISHLGFSRGAENLSTHQLTQRFQSLTSLNRRTKTNAVHISLNFAPGENLKDEVLEEISRKYLNKIGFGNQPCLVYQHFDAGHPHLHLVTVNIDREGKRIETHNLGKNQSEKARKEIEQEFALVPAEKQKRIGPSIQELGKLVYGQETTKSSIQTVLNHVWNNYTFSSLGEFNAILSGFGVCAYRGEKDSERYRKGGLVFHLLDKQGKRKGVPIKASSFYLKPTLKKLKFRFARDLEKKKELCPLVKDRVVEILGKSNSLKGFQDSLKKSGILLVLNYTDTGQIYGTSYVDHLHRVGVKGSDLGKEFGANDLSRRFGLVPLSSAKPLSKGEASKFGAKVNKDWVRQTFKDLEIDPIPDFSLVLSDSPYQGPVRRERKKRKKKKDHSSES
ncbi:relaxase/mobilization nuclease domain-containing protein [Algoriphagus formosus]|uniref:relaxase/mobilization nuclease domain-containing protein n=1 Tax=Algoriphagus formosus TaxID=2007308 RepID=UPI000C290BAF|nr:relaxase/mobilization nuclease domain-containing protein [Algoriphagus formosus]